LKVASKYIKDECQYCGKILKCKLFRQGHGIKQERCNVTEMLRCQFEHKEKRENEK